MFVWTLDDVGGLLALGFILIIGIIAGVIRVIDKVQAWWQDRWIDKNIPELGRALKVNPKETLALELGCIYYSLTDAYDDSVCAFRYGSDESSIPSSPDEYRKCSANARRIRKACAAVAADRELDAGTYEAGFEVALQMGRVARDALAMSCATLRAVQEELS